jgi:hypothetical protein
MNKKWFLTAVVMVTFLVNSFSFSFAAQRGDLNSDNSVNSIDFAIYRSFLLGSHQIDDETIADLNGDGLANALDFGVLRQYLLGMITSFPVNETVTPTATAAIPTPTDTVTDPKEAWKNNQGTINLGNSITYTGSGISVSGTTVYIRSGGDHTVSGTLSNGMIYVDTNERVKLRLNNASITNSNGPAIYGHNVDKLLITLEKGTTNTLVDGRSYSDQTLKAALFCNDDLEIKGSGTLNITGNYKHAICSDDDINIENGTINVLSAAKDGIHANGSIDITGGTLNINANSDAIQNEDKEGITIDDGILNLSAGDQGIRSKTGVKIAGGITINGGNIKITKAREGIAAELITVNGGTISIIASDDGFNASMGGGSWSNDGSKLIINGGSIYASAQTGDALDSNGIITITGGTVVAVGPQSSPNVPIDCNGTFTVTGGTVLATGPAMLMAQYPDGPSTQYSLALGLSSSQPANSAVCIKDSSGKVLFITKPIRNYINILFSSPELRNGSTYTVSYGGTVSGGTEVNGVITGGTYSGGSSTNVTINNSPTTAVNWNGGGFGGGGFPGGGFPGGGFPGGGFGGFGGF